ncbi:hypothetical protein BDZ89DRAFT_1150182 [Hymenopellis radicata]|nr:hypothetical protein BDZ89DRAFT_1150182 [Hymenopellis radicata]
MSTAGTKFKAKKNFFSGPMGEFSTPRSNAEDNGKSPWNSGREHPRAAGPTPSRMFTATNDTPQSTKTAPLPRQTSASSQQAPPSSAPQPRGTTRPQTRPTPSPTPSRRNDPNVNGSEHRSVHSQPRSQPREASEASRASRTSQRAPNPPYREDRSIPLQALQILPGIQLHLQILLVRRMVELPAVEEGRRWSSRTPGPPAAVAPQNQLAGGGFQRDPSEVFIKGELKPENIPTWDGNAYKAVEYFSKVINMAALGPRMPEYLGAWLWKSFEEDSDIYTWFNTLPPLDQAEARQSVYNMLNLIKEDFLGDSWQALMNDVFESQRFRQRSHETESLKLSSPVTPVGSQEEARAILRRAPIVWRPILNSSTVRDTKMLMARVIEQSKALVISYTQDTGRSGFNQVRNEVANVLKQMGIEPKDRERTRYRNPANANLMTTQDAEEGVSVCLDNPEEEHGDCHHEACQVGVRKQRPPPKEYFFKRNDKPTKFQKPPPSSCKICSSPLHWDKECPHAAEYEALLKRKSAHHVTVEEEYERTFQAMIIEQSAAEQFDMSRVQGFEVASCTTQVTEASRVESKSDAGNPPAKRRHSVEIEDVTDSDECENVNNYSSERYTVEPILPEETESFSKPQGQDQDPPGVETSTSDTSEPVTEEKPTLRNIED